MRERYGKPAFTLIELLVVVSIIALLIAILLPSLRRAREQAKMAACIANLKGIATASVVYSSDDPHENAIPVHPVIVDTRTPSGSSKTSVTVMAYGGKSGRGRVQGNKNYWGTLSGRGPATRPMNQAIYKTGFNNYAPPPYGDYQQSDLIARVQADTELKLDLFRCPSDDGPPRNAPASQQWKETGLPAYDHYGTSYRANAMWVTNQTWLGANAAMLRPLSRVPNPANTVYYQEQVGHAFWWCDPQPVGECGYDHDPRTITGWHKRDFYFGVAFCDAHAESVKMQGYESPMLSSYPGCDDPSPLQCYINFCRVIMRGNGWQLDTLPAPIVWTDLPDDG